MSNKHNTAPDDAETATEAKLRLDEEAQQDRWAEEADAERRAESAWLRRAEYDAELAYDLDIEMQERRYYGDL